VGKFTFDAFGTVIVFAFAGYGVEGRCSLHLPVVVIVVVVDCRSGACLFDVQLFALAFAGALSIVGGGRGLGACLLPTSAVTLLTTGTYVVPVIDT